ncbi:MAG TPA: O-antigen ligase family protein [Ktedonobacteraceae bacterium]|nr:O-antigen ligase family protein [Ktedonobacteraceae bacterium]
MNSQNSFLPLSNANIVGPEAAAETPPSSSSRTPTGNGKTFGTLTPFWHDRLFEVGLILSMFLYYVVGNPDLHILYLSHFSLLLNQLLSIPFLLVFAILCWYRLPSAIALLPLTLPFYLLQKVVIENTAFSIAEVTLGTCLIIALLHFLFGNRARLSWSQWKERIGPFLWPILAFCAFAAISIVIAYSRRIALRAFHEEVLAPLLYLALALAYLRTRQDLRRLLMALFGTGLLVALLGMAQYLLFKHTLILENGAFRVHAMYGSANSIGLFFDYVLPLGLAVLLGRVAVRSRLLALAALIIMFPVLYLTDSGGAWLAIAVAFLFVVALSMRNRRLVLIGGSVLVVVVALGLLVFHSAIIHYIIDRHVNAQGQSSVTKRFYLWQSAWQMIQHSPWLGYGLENWLCYYSRNTVCLTNIHHYWITVDPVTHQLTGLRDEPDLSHPHNIFLQIWVSMGIFGLLAFVAVLAFFTWLFVRILRYLEITRSERYEQWRWMLVGVGAGMLAALVQGLVDSSFLEQDLAFCFWMLTAALLLLRAFIGVPWRGRLARSVVANE